MNREFAHYALEVVTMNVMRPIAVALAVTLVCAQAGRGTIAGELSGSQDVSWSSIQTPYYTLRYANGYKADAERMQAHLDRGISALCQNFASQKADTLLKGLDCKITLHPTPNSNANEGTANIQCGVVGTKYSAEIDLLTPSAYSKDARSSVGEPKDDDYQAKLIVHEYSTILLDRITRSKPKGWRFFSGPSWFVQGYEEYLGLTCSSPRNREVVLAKFLQIQKENPKRVAIGFGIGVQEPYIGGAMLVHFMHEKYGRDRVQSILTSQRSTFEEAVPAALGITLSDFAKHWEDWRRKLE